VHVNRRRRCQKRFADAALVTVLQSRRAGQGVIAKDRSRSGGHLIPERTAAIALVVAVLRSDATDELGQRLTRAARPDHDGAVVHRHELLKHFTAS